MLFLAPIPGYPNYVAHASGKIWSRITQKYLSTKRTDKDGYHTVELGRNCRRCVHHLIALAFIGPRPEGQVVRHLNDDKDDNGLWNLAYGSKADNTADYIRNSAR